MLTRNLIGACAVFLWAACSSTAPTPPKEAERPSPPIGQFFPITRDEADALLERLPAFQPPASAPASINLRDRSLPPPKTGEVKSLSFLPSVSEAPAAPEAPELSVLRVTPEGEVDFAKSVSIVFNQPMIALGSVQEITSPPAMLTPQPAGRWRWVGDRILSFEPTAERLSMSTDFTVEVPAGLTSANGKTLTETKRSTFSTPTPKLLRSSPTGEEVSTSPLLLLVFTQQIDAAKVLAALQLKAGAQLLEARPATLSELIKEDLLFTVAQLPEKTFLTLRLSKELPKNTKIEVLLPVGAYSLEGPRPTPNPESFSFQTYGPFSVSFTCSYDTKDKLCERSGWDLQFSNPLSEDFAEDTLTLTPPIRDYEVSVYGDHIYLNGLFQADTEYTLTLPAATADAFGQTLGKELRIVRKTHTAPRSLSGPSREVITLSPHQKPELTFYSDGYSSLRVKMYRVAPTDYAKIAALTDERYPDEKLPPPPGELVSETSLAVSPTERDTQAIIDLTPALRGGIGQVLVSVTPEAPTSPDEIPPLFYRWVNVTNLGVDVFVDGSKMVVFASSLKDNQHLSGVQLTLYPDNIQATTDASGAVIFALPGAKTLKPDEDPPDYFLTATSGNDSVLLNPYSWSVTRDPDAEKDSIRWYVIDDRRLYKPGEQVSLKGILRRQGVGEKRDLVYLGDAVQEVSYVLTDSLNNKLSEGKAPVSRTGTFSLVLPLPKTINLGLATLKLSIAGDLLEQEHQHSFRVEEFRRPEFEVTARAEESKAPALLGGTAEVSVTATYYTGGGLPEAPVAWTITPSPTSFTPPDNDGFSFGGDSWDAYQKYKPAGPKTIEGFTDLLGRHTAPLDLSTLIDVDYPLYFSANASVTDVNQQKWAASTGVLAHAGTLYPGLRSTREKPEANQPITIEAIVAAIDGKRVANQKLQLKATRLSWTYQRGDWSEEELPVGECQLTSGIQAASCTFQLTEGGQYLFTTTATDERGKQNTTALSVYVPGGENPNEPPPLVLALDKDEDYQPGDAAKLFIQSPFAAVEGVVFIESHGIVKTIPVSIGKVYGSVSIPVEEWMMPGVQLSVFAVGLTQKKAPDGSLYPPRPTYATDSISLSVSLASRTLSVSVKTQKKVLTATGAVRRDIKDLPPGGKAEIEVLVKDRQGKPVKGAEVSVIVVDEAVLDIARWSHPDPLWRLYERQWSYQDEVSAFHSRDALQDKEDLVRVDAIDPNSGSFFGSVGSGMGGGGSGEGFGSGSGTFGKDEGDFEVRKNLDALALFAMDLKTDAKGLARVPVTLPDSLTRYRVFALAATEKSFGSATNSLTAKLPMMVRPSLPRFLRDGDTAQLPIVVQNLRSEPIVVEVALRAQNASVTEPGFRMHIPANDRLRVFFTVHTETPGTARFQAVARSEKYKDAIELSIPVYSPNTTEESAFYGQLDAGVLSQPFALPEGASPDYGGLTLQTSSTAVSSLTDAVVYLNAYPYECSEQLSSRMIAFSAVYDVLDAFSSEGLPSREDLNLRLKKDIDKLLARHHSSGGFGFWSASDDHWPYVSLHAIHGLLRAKEMGLSIPESNLLRADSYLKGFERGLDKHDFSLQTKTELLAYALYLQKLSGRPDESRARRLLAEQPDLSLEAAGRLLFALSSDPASVATLKAALLSKVIETASEATFAASLSEEQRHVLLATSRRADAIILEALLAASPQEPLIPKLVASLMSHRTAGRWSSTQENVFVLLALSKYFKTFEAKTPDFALQAWLGEAFVGTQDFRGRSTQKNQLFVSMRDLSGLEGNRVTLSKEGEGRLYYRLGLSYAPAKIEVAAADYGFFVERSYEALRDPSDVVKQADGSWRIKSGATIKVKLSVAASAPRSHVALVDQLPAGFEIQNTSLAMTPSEGQEDSWQWWRRTWYEHQNRRDDRVEVFTTLMPAGVHHYTYIVRATTPGAFLVPSTKAEEMYSPEVFGRSASEKIIIEAPSEQL